MASLGKTLIETITIRGAGDPRPLGPRAGPGRRPRRQCSRPATTWRRFARRAENLYERVPRLDVPARDLSLRDPGRRRSITRHRPHPVRRLPGPDGSPVRAGDHRVSPRPRRRRAERHHRQRPGAGLRADCLPDARRPGPAVGPELPGKPLDVPGRRRATSIPLRIHPRLLERESDDALFPILVERTPVRLDLSHSAWSDIFFLGMDYPEGARVLNISVDLGVHGRDAEPAPPIESRAPRDPRAASPADEHRPERLQGRRPRSTSCSTSATTTSGW